MGCLYVSVLWKRKPFAPNVIDSWASLSSSLSLVGQAGTVREPETSLAQNLMGHSQEDQNESPERWPPAPTRRGHGVGLSPGGCPTILLPPSVRVEPNHGRRVSEPRFSLKRGLSWRELSELRQADSSV